MRQRHQNINIQQSISCPECRKKYQSSPDSSQSQQIIIPLRRHYMTQQNKQMQVQSQLQQLQNQLKILKLNNKNKDTEIYDLKKRVNIDGQHHKIFEQIQKQNQQIHRLKQQLIKYQRKQKQKFEAFVYDNEPISQYMIHVNKQNKSRTPKFSPCKFSQKQYSQKKSMKKSCFCDKQLHWMKNFINAFIQMIENFSQKYNEKIFCERWKLKKKAKVGWRYLKHLIQFWLH